MQTNIDYILNYALYLVNSFERGCDAEQYWRDIHEFKQMVEEYSDNEPE